MDTGVVRVTSADALPPPVRSDQTAGRHEYLIGPSDQLAIQVFGLPELSLDEIRVDSAGYISLPLVGSVEAGGKTPAQLIQVVTEQLRAGGVRNPKVSVNVKEMLSQVFTVDGEVRRPGSYPISGRATLMRSIARAEGTSDMADARRVVIFRTVGEQRMAALYDLRAIRMGAYADPEVYPNDVIVVGESATRRLLPVLVQGASVLLTPLIYLVR